jgi:two-component system, NtrC family, response regulator AtoC
MSEYGCVTLRSILLVDSADRCAETLAKALGALCRQLLRAVDLPSCLQQLAPSSADLVVLSEDIAPQESLELVRGLHQACPELPVVVVLSQASVEQAVRFVRAGAADVIPSPLAGDRLERLMQAAAPASAVGKGQLVHPNSPPGMSIVGRSPAMTRMLETIGLVARSQCNPVLILGETGTGKELAAQAVHRLRHGKDDPFVAVNCASLSASLLESELFGHVKGAFTGADRDKTGLLELANGGSIFLDEISEMPLELQPKLLRVLQERVFRKVGGTKDIRCNATFIATSNRPLAQEAREGKFRRDLYYRLAVFPVTLPPLRDRDRRGDIPLLAEYFLKNSAVASGSVAGMTKAAQEMLLAHDWPGNVRELKNVIDRALIVERSAQITPESLCIESEPPTVTQSSCAGEAMDLSLATAEKEFILRALKETNWQRTKAALLLGISRATLHAKLKSYDIHSPSQPSAGEDDIRQAAM